MKKTAIVSVLGLIFLLMVTRGASGEDKLYTPDARIADRVEIAGDYALVGPVFDFETGFGRVKVTAKGGNAGFTAKLNNNFEIGYEYIDFDIDSYFRDAAVGTSQTDAHQLSVKAVFPAKMNIEPHRIRYGAQYIYLDNSVISGIHFANIFGTTSLGTVEATAGISSYFGNDVDNTVGVFGNLSYTAGNEVELFAEYNTADYLKAVQYYLIAPSAANVGVIGLTNTPEDAFSVGVKLNLRQGYVLKFAVYDLSKQMRPVIGLAFKK
ncbi:MAG: hypothetical protein AB1742_05075 [bacterium]